MTYIPSDPDEVTQQAIQSALCLTSTQSYAGLALAFRAVAYTFWHYCCSSWSYSAKAKLLDARGETWIGQPSPGNCSKQRPCPVNWSGLVCAHQVTQGIVRSEAKGWGDKQQLLLKIN